MDNNKREMLNNAEKIVMEQLGQLRMKMNQFREENQRDITKEDLEEMGIQNVIKTIENAIHDLDDESGEVLEMMQRVTESLNLSNDGFQFMMMNPEELAEMEAEEEKEDIEFLLKKEMVRQEITGMSDDEIMHIIEVAYEASKTVAIGSMNSIVTRTGATMLKQIYDSILQDVAFMVGMSGREIDYFQEKAVEKEAKEKQTKKEGGAFRAD